MILALLSNMGFRVVKILSTTMVEKYGEDSFSLSLFLKEIVKLSDIHDF